METDLSKRKRAVAVGFLVLTLPTSDRRFDHQTSHVGQKLGHVDPKPSLGVGHIDMKLICWGYRQIQLCIYIYICV